MTCILDTQTERPVAVIIIITQQKRMMINENDKFL